MAIHDNIQESLRSLIPINSLSATKQEQLLRSAELLQLRKKEAVFTQGSRDSFTYYLLQGTLEMIADDQLIKTVEGGTMPAFHPLAQLQPRQMSAIAKTPSVVVRLSRAMLDQMLSLAPDALPEISGVELTEISVDEGDDAWLTELLQSELFTRIPPSHIQKLLSMMEPVEAAAGTTIIEQGSLGDYYYVLKRGRAEVTRRASRGTQNVKLAELKPGDSFGEEALVAGGQRNASISMITDGEIMRLTKENFIELIQRPLLHTTAIKDAQDLVTKGAKWLDVRFPEEHQQGHIPGSINIPLNLLRSKLKDLDRSQAYITYCDGGGRSSVAAFLLSQRGFTAYCVSGNNALQLIPAETVASTKPADGNTAAVATPATSSEKVTNAEVRASVLKAEVGRADLQIADAKRLHDSPTPPSPNAGEQTLDGEKMRMLMEQEQAAQIMEEIQALKARLERERASAEEEAVRLRREHEAEMTRLKHEAEARLQTEQTRLQSLYQVKTEELEALEAARARDEQTKQQQAAALREAGAASQAQLADERRKLEAEFARNTAMVEIAKQEKAAAEAARIAAAKEAEKIIGEYKAVADKQRLEAEAQLEAQRKQLEQERARLAESMKAARSAREDAEAAQREAEAAAQTLRESETQKIRAQADMAVNKLREEIENIEATAAAASSRLQKAKLNEKQLEAEQERNTEELERTYTKHGELRAKLAQELTQWVNEQEDRENATADRHTFARMKTHAERIKQQVDLARADATEHDQSLLHELASIMTKDRPAAKK